MDLTEKPTGKEKNQNQLYLFKITLQGIRPPIWRRILVPGNYSFWDLHVAIQDAMGWTDSHLHAFEVVDPESGETETVGSPDALENDDVIVESTALIAEYFTFDSKTATYEYDFGDDWSHTVELEKIEPANAKVASPVCLDGKRACPPEDVGGPPGYEDFLNAIADPKHGAHKEMLDWVGGSFDPEEFLPSEVAFDDPRERLRTALSLE
jgi:hypothetical protein